MAKLCEQSLFTDIFMMFLGNSGLFAKCISSGAKRLVALAAVVVGEVEVTLPSIYHL